MTRQDTSFLPELRAASDAVIEDAIAGADPMVPRGLFYQLSGDPEVAPTGVPVVPAEGSRVIPPDRLPSIHG